MSKVITFSRFFPATHPKKGQETFFIEKIWAGLADIINDFKIPDEITDWDWYEYYNARPKNHTIRAGSRWKVGDKFSPRVWSGKPYCSKQITFAPDIEIRKIWDIGLRVRGDFKEFYCGDCDITTTSISKLAANDGLSVQDLFSWFNKPFVGQIICWNDKIEY